MATSSSAVRQALVASQRALARRAAAPLPLARRRSMSSAALALPLDEPLDLPIFDIFDAPSRLGESSKLLADAARSRVRPAERTLRTSALAAPARAPPKALPAPTLYDGPARPRGLSGPRTRLIHSRALAPAQAHPLPAALPPPVMFDGPSRLRPYLRDGSASDESVSFTTLLVGAAAVGTLAWTAWSKVEEKAERIKRQRAQRRATYQQDFV
ncbi:hypothetical protein PsYK624_096330 [Phanerochaete sordida]|uniref:Uncharacterized protein n=1 Tax=Phanerochaete sordida TaxID=48140 RepID=A0A9P3LGB4_9APHY|nr:hypothetical protein PsYK624_096330 [Phanerochaete sordida]